MTRGIKYRLAALFLTAAGVLSLAGCGNSGSNKKDNKTTEVVASDSGTAADDTTESGNGSNTENSSGDSTGSSTEDNTGSATTEGGNSLLPETTIPELSIEKYDIPDNEGMRFVNNLRIGFSLGNTFDAYVDTSLKDEMDTETAWNSAVVTEQIVKDYHAAGFDTIRIPVSWHNHFMDDDYTISEKWMNRVNEVVDWAINDGMYVIINIHHDNHPEANGFYPDEEHMDQSVHYIERIWTQLSERYKDYDDKLIFESMNEPRLVGHQYEWWIPGNDADVKESIECINKLNQVFVDTVRASGGNNETRYLMCPGYDASADGALNSGFVLPEDPTGPADHILVSVHAYTPYDFALNLSGTSYFSVEKKKGTSDIDSFMDKLYNKFVAKGIPVVIGEFGALDKDRNLQERVDFSAYYIASARARGMTALWWDNNAFSGSGENFGLYYRFGGYFMYQDIVDALMKYVD
ncbi:MAG: glycoside hydrolase family 5 protein [Eubacterium sp.]|nr:glycoside hydrolase family 5 protein [Eubacterium sp.]